MSAESVTHMTADRAFAAHWSSSADRASGPLTDEIQAVAKEKN